MLAQQGADGQLVAGLPVVETQKPFGDGAWYPFPLQKGGRAALEIRAELHPSVGAHLRTVGTRHLVDLEPTPKL